MGSGFVVISKIISVQRQNLVILLLWIISDPIRLRECTRLLNLRGLPSSICRHIVLT